MEKGRENVKQVNNLLNALENETEEKSLTKVADFLGYELFKNPVDPKSEWRLVSHKELENDSQSLMSLKYDSDLTKDSSVRDLRKRYSLVEDQKEKFRGYDVYLYAFVGQGRILIFKGYDSNRDERIDISEESIEKVSLFTDNFLELQASRIEIEEDEFGFGKQVVGLDRLFKRELTKLFTLTIQSYRKLIAETITTNKSLEDNIMQLLPDYEKKSLKRQKLKDKLLNPNFKQAIGSVIDTIVLRVVLRRFLESYHGLDLFTKQDDFQDLGLGQREGKMQDVIDYLANIQYKTVTEGKLKSFIESEETGQGTWDLFGEITQDIEFKKTEVSFAEIHNRLREQFEMAYGGDLFSSDVSEVVNQVEREINQIKPELLLHLMVDTSEERFNFRYEDLPPEMIQEFYETSMGFSLHYLVNDDGKPSVTYSDDLQEKKHRGAYYTKPELVDYMVARTVGSKLDAYISELSKGIEDKDKTTIFVSLQNISSMTVMDITCGGGSFLRGAFRYISSKREGVIRALEKINDSDLYNEIIEQFPYFAVNSEAATLWEKHVLLRMVYGKDIDYKALIISSQTLTLSALNNWQIGVNFPSMIGLTLVQQNALISPVRVSEREAAFAPFKKEIGDMIALKEDIINETNAAETKKLSAKLEGIRIHVQEELYKRITPIIKEEYKEALMPQATEINFPEIFFKPNGELKDNPGFTVGIGNPPWEIWKANAEEFFEVYDSNFRTANRKTKELIKQEVFKRNPALRTKWEWFQGYYEAGSNYFLHNDFYDFQRVKVDGSYTGGDINLYKVSTEKNYQILASGGKCGYLVPSSIYTDRGSTGIREMMFNHSSLTEIASFENRKGIFSNVHRSYKFAVMLFSKGNKTENFRAFFYKQRLETLYNQDEFIQIPVELVKNLSPGTFSVMEFRQQMEVELMKKIVQFPNLADTIEQSWNLRLTREFDLTNDSGLFNEDGNGIPLFAGRTINQYTTDGTVEKWIDEQVASGRYKQKEINRIKKLGELEYSKQLVDGAPSNYFKFGCRAISRSTDKRSLISTILPREVAFANSLLVSEPYELAVQNDEIIKKPLYSIADLTIMVGMMNSFVVDFVLRRKISANVNMFYLYQLPVPRLKKGDEYFDEISERVARLICVKPEYDEIKNAIGIRNGALEDEKRQLIQNQIDAYVAKIYGLNRDEMLYILSTFKSTNHKEEMQEIGQGVIEQFDILEEEGALECPK